MIFVVISKLIWPFNNTTGGLETSSGTSKRQIEKTEISCNWLEMPFQRCEHSMKKTCDEILPTSCLPLVGYFTLIIFHTPRSSCVSQRRRGARRIFGCFSSRNELFEDNWWWREKWSFSCLSKKSHNQTLTLSFLCNDSGGSSGVFVSMKPVWVA